MLFPLKMEDFGHVFKMLSDREAPDASTIFWFVFVLLAIPLLLTAVYYYRRLLIRKRNRERNYEVLDRASGSKDLNYLEQVTLERMAEAANLHNPTQLLNSQEAFDQAAAKWMEKVIAMPWLEMEEHLERLTSARQKLSFRYVQQGRRYSSTREIVLGHELYILGVTKKGYRLLSAPVIELDDLAIRTEFFRDKKGPVRFKKKQEIWVFFWSGTGAEYRFPTQVLKEVRGQAHYLMLKHGDSLPHDPDRKTFSCDFNQQTQVTRLPASEVGQATPSKDLFEAKSEHGESRSVQLVELSGSGFGLTAEETFDVGDHVRIEEGPEVPKALWERIAKVVETTAKGAHVKFGKLTPEARKALLSYITPRISSDQLSQKTQQKPVASP